MKRLAVILLLLLPFASTRAQDSIYITGQYQFLSYSSIPAWTGVATAWNTGKPVIHLYDPQEYKGHAEFISRGLKTGITFKQFKEQVKHYDGRKYLPFFLYDLRRSPVRIDETQYQWAVRIEDYGYGDTPAQMAATVNKLFLTLSQFTNSDKGIVILATSNTVQPNISIAGSLKDIHTLTLSQLIERAGGSKIKVLNPGTAYGYLRYAAADSAGHFSPSDIVIYERLPVRVPPVAGFITLEPQTPLSHVNLLAMNRGTINLYATDIAMLPGAEALIGKPMKIICSEKQISISTSTPAEVDKYIKQHAQVLTIEAPRLLKEIIDLGTAGPEMLSVKVMGAKAANYGLLQQNLPGYVRPGFAVPFGYYAEAVKQCGADTLIEKLLESKDALTQAQRASLLMQVRATIEDTRMDTGFLNRFYAFLNEKFPGKKVRLRSSTNCEDLPGFNGAGLYISEGFNASGTKRQLEKALLKVYASIWNDEAFEEREFYHIDHHNVKMAVLINEAYTNEYANGVVLTVPSGKGWSMIVNSQPGDALVTNPQNGQVPESLIFDSLSSSGYRIDTRSSIRDVFVCMRSKHHTGCEDQLWAELRLAELRLVTLKVQKLLREKYAAGSGVDIEFRLMKEENDIKLYFKQARLLSTQFPQ